MRRWPLVLLAVFAGACATVEPTAPPATPPGPATPAPRAEPLPRTAEPPPPPVNLSGFPLPYRQGYADGCASAAGPERKDATRWSADGNYRTGWQDGLWQCRRKK